jgi:cell division protein FtsQ
MPAPDAGLGPATRPGATRPGRPQDDAVISATKAIPDSTVVPDASGPDGGPGSPGPGRRIGALRIGSRKMGSRKSAARESGVRKAGVRNASVRKTGDSLAGVRSAGARLAGLVRRGKPDAVPAGVETRGDAEGTPAGTPGARATVLAFPEPPGRRRRRRWLVWGSAAVALIAGLLAAIVFSPLLAVRTIVVEGNVLAPSDQVNAALEPLKGVPLPQVDEGRVEGLLDSLPPVDEIDVVAQPPSTLLVQVRERVPVAVLQDGDRFVLIDRLGTQLADVPDRESARLPLIDGGAAATDGAVFSTITDVLAALPAPVLAQLEHASAATEDSVELKLTDGRKIVWGNAEDNDLKARVLEALLAAPEGEVPVAVYDISAPSRPVTR